MPNNPDILDTGRIERDMDSTGKNPTLDYAAGVRRDLRFGANVDLGDHSPTTDRALHDAIAANVGCRRNKIYDEKLPTDPLDSALTEEPPAGKHYGQR